MYKPLILLGALALCLSACNQEKPAETTAEAPAAPSGVVREEPAAPAAAPAPAPAALGTQPGPQGTQVALTKARVVGDVLSVELHYTQAPNANTSVFIHTDVDQINYVDDATSRKYDVLHDQQGSYMAQPMNRDGKRLDLQVRKEGPSVLTLKFPAPPAASTTVSLNVPEVGSFDAIPLQR